MPRPALRTSSAKEVRKRRKHGVKILYKNKKAAKPSCGLCKGPINGVPHVTSAQLARIPKTKKRPEVPFGGHLCTKCRRKVFTDAALVAGQAKELNQVSLKHKNFTETVLAKM